MAITRQNKTYEVKIVDLGGHEFTATDTAEAKVGKAAFDLFMHGQVVEIKGEEKTIYIPYQSICHVEVTVTSAEEQVDDDTCKDIDWCCKGDGESNDPVNP